MDLYRLLEDMVDDNHTLPKAATSADPQGLTLVANWLPGRMEQLRQRSTLKDAEEEMAGELR